MPQYKQYASNPPLQPTPPSTARLSGVSLARLPQQGVAKLMKRLVYTAIIRALIYASVGLSLHFKWKSDWKACQEWKVSKGAFV
ncbi:hypothetical protein Cagg_0455 [Chloroflexus aggregans DSM 9485]|uniref:Uncharacterized protein n=1 Tax=Chloroflexus aggregans (strain MD-66 / DSM 9485) TaxID=326427 RepID=B8G3L4_CHLAD|nr:hypothetical protein Cagg_0455 [Chloroflexus aggregans DSM 9485]